jgi:hypothetical protein
MRPVGWPAATHLPQPQPENTNRFKVVSVFSSQSGVNANNGVGRYASHAKLTDNFGSSRFHNPLSRLRASATAGTGFRS